MRFIVIKTPKFIGNILKTIFGIKTNN
ncbi:stage V sporulation protein SpoVM [Defluviitalea phaphyphila]